MKVVMKSLFFGLIFGLGSYFSQVFGPGASPMKVYEKFSRARRMNVYEIARPLVAGPALNYLVDHEAAHRAFIATLAPGDRNLQRQMWGSIHDIKFKITSREKTPEGGVKIKAVETVRRLRGGARIAGVDPNTDYNITVEIRKYSNGWMVYSFEEERVFEPNETRRSSGEAVWGALN